MKHTQTENLGSADENIPDAMAALIDENAQLRRELATLRSEAAQRAGTPPYGQIDLDQSSLTDAMPQILWTSTAMGLADYFNRGWFDYTGMTFEQSRRSGWRAVLHPDDLKRAIDCGVAARAAGEPYDGEFRLKRGSDGTYRWHLSRVSPMRDTQGQIVCWVGTSTDIHDYKVTQQSLSHQRQELESRVAERTAALADTVQRLQTEKLFIAAIVDNVSDGIVACDAKGVVILINPAAQAFHGLGLETVAQEQWAEHYDLFLADGLTPMTAEQVPLARVLNGEQIGKVEVVVKPKRGLPPRRLIAAGNLFFDADGNKLGAVVGLHDISERSAADERFRVLFQHSSDAHLLFDDTGIIDCNNAAIALLRCADKAQLLTLHPAAMSPEFQPDGRLSMEKCFEMDATARRVGTHRFEWIHRKMDGTDFPVEVTITPIQLKGKDSMIVVWHDLTERKKAEDALSRTNNELRQSEQRFQAFMDNCPVIAWIKDEVGRYNFINHRWVTEFSAPGQDAIGKRDDALFPPERAARFALEDRDILEGGTFAGDSKVVSITGESRDWQVNKFLLVGPDGRRYVAGLAMDVTAQRKAEEALRESEQRLRLALAAGAMGTFIVDLARGVVTNDEVMNRLHGLNPDILEWDLETGFERVHPDDRAITKASLETVIATGRGEPTDYRIVLPDGSIRWLSGIGRMAGPHQVVGVQFDITDRKQHQDLIRQSEQRFQTFMDRSPALVFIKDEEGRFAYFNEPFKRMFPAASDAIGKTDPDVFPADILCKLQAMFEKVLHGESIETELAVATPDGSQHQFAITKFRFVDADGRKYVGAMWHDVTELVRARQGAEAASRSKSEFLANMSHEIRTPMTAILGHVDLLDQRDVSARERKEHLEVIRRNGQHLLTVLNDVLDLSKIEAGKMSIELIAFSPAELLAEMESLVSLRAMQKRIGFAVETRPGTPELMLSDPTRLRQILLNLVGNAIKFTEEGSVRVIVGPESAAKGKNGSARVRFDVIDTGIGMSTEQQASLFSPFSQADSSTSRRFGGSGLGLAICKRLASMLGGTLSATSATGRGTTFTFTVDAGLPHPAPSARKINAASAPSRARKKAPAQLSGRVLIAEDSRDTRLMIRALLKDAGLTVDIAKNGRAAVDRIVAAADDGRPYDMVLMDMQMPVLDGYAAAREVRTRGFASLPLIAFTAHALEVEREKCLAAGCDGCVSKPIDFAALLALIAQQLERSRRAPVFSRLSNHPVVNTLLPVFVSGLPAVAEELRINLNRPDFAAILDRAHKLRGTGDLYGFPDLTLLAAEVEDSFKPPADADEVSKKVNCLIDMLLRVELLQLQS